MRGSDGSSSDESSIPFLGYGDSKVPTGPLKRRRKLVYTIGVLFAFFCMWTLSTFVRQPERDVDLLGPANFHSEIQNETVFTHPPGVKGPPTLKFRDNLIPDRQYITTWPGAGWTNDVMAYGNLIYLALLTDRIPILPPFTPSHIGGDAGNIQFGEVFDIPRLAQELRVPLVEWSDVKQKDSHEIESLGGWAVWQSQQYFDDQPRLAWLPQQLGLDIAYTKAPAWIKALPGNVHDRTSNFWDLAKLAFPDAWNEYLNSSAEITRTPSPEYGVTLDPDEHLLCIDYLFYVSANYGGDIEADYSPAWRFVLKHLRFTERIDSIADDYLRSMFGVASDAPIPPYITIHMRRGDFGAWCNDMPKEDCFPSMAVIDRRVQEIKDELAQKYPGMDVQHVVMTSDERDERWWDQVAELGWYMVDHSETVQNYGRWYPVIIDAVIQSRGKGFVGTYMSTFSTIARRRVADWQQGVTRTIRWGRKGADDH